MSDYVLKTSNLTKQFKNQVALNKVNLSIKKGSIYGFIGQNGAGKSTFIRIVTGLANPTTGSIELFGQSNGQELIKARKRIGTIIESGAILEELALILHSRARLRRKQKHYVSIKENERLTKYP